LKGQTRCSRRRWRLRVADPAGYVGVFEGHSDPAVAVVRNGRALAYAEEERFVRVKHAFGMYPVRALRSCLDRARLKPEQVAAIGVNLDVPAYSDGSMARFFKQLNRRSEPDEATRAWQRGLLARFSAQSVRARHEYHWRRSFGNIRVPPVHSLPHHYTHALHAYLQSPFDQALCMTIDGSGDRHCTVLWDCCGRQIQPIREICIPDSLGWYYAAFTEYLGFQAYDGEYKVMGLSPYGRPDAELQRKVAQVLSPAEDGVGYRLDLRYIHRGPHTWSGRFTDDLADLFGHLPRLADAPVTRWHENLAYAVQQGLEEAVCRLARWGLQASGAGNLCIGGGVGLNVKLNGRLRSLPGVKGFFAQPLCADGGAAAGAALGACWQLSGLAPAPLETLALGPEESEAHIREVLDACQIHYQRVADIAEAAAGELAAGRIVGWFQGAMEAGPRALGQRSILADPRCADMRDRVNAAVKYREYWRPFCPSIPAEDADEFLGDWADGWFMNVCFGATERLRREAPAIVHVDGTSRAQIVRQPVLPLFHRLLKAFGRRTGLPALLNTSFNVKGEPIVCTITDALRTFFGTGLDVLAVGPFLVRKHSREVSGAA
jgi:carbamoyltransferase